MLAWQTTAGGKLPVSLSLGLSRVEKQDPSWGGRADLADLFLGVRPALLWSSPLFYFLLLWSVFRTFQREFLHAANSYFVQRHNNK